MKFKYSTLLKRREALDKKIKHTEYLYNNVNMPNSLRNHLADLKSRLRRYDIKIMEIEADIAAKAATAAIDAARKAARDK